MRSPRLLSASAHNQTRFCPPYRIVPLHPAGLRYPTSFVLSCVTSSRIADNAFASLARAKCALSTPLCASLIDRQTAPCAARRIASAKGHSSWRILRCATQQMLAQKSVGPLPAENRQQVGLFASAVGSGQAHVTAPPTPERQVLQMRGETSFSGQDRPRNRKRTVWRN